VTPGVAEIRRARVEGLRPDPALSVSAWADRYRVLPRKSSAEPGPWRTSRTPYLREIMDALSPESDVEEVVLMFGAQLGKSEVILNLLGYIIDHSPGPVIIVQPTEGMAKRFSRQRIGPLIQSTPRLHRKVGQSRSRDSGNTVYEKEFPSGHLVITWASSAVGLRSMPAQYALLDEIDGYVLDVDDEGSPIELVEGRQSTFARRKRVKTSTPTVAGRSAIEEAYEASDQRRFYVPCPDCGERQPLEFPRLIWSKLGLPPDQAVYECRACTFPIPHHRKSWLLEHGEWIPEAPTAGGRVRGYHLSALYSPLGWTSWGDLARRFVRVEKQPAKFRAFINTFLGQTWKEVGEAPEWRRLYDRRETYTVGVVPRRALFLTAGCDVQRDRLIVEVVGWGRDKESWSVSTEFFLGDTSNLQGGPWSELDALLDRYFTHETGKLLPIRTLAVDSGDQTQTVYAWTRRKPTRRVMAVKGFNYGSTLFSSPTRVDVTLSGRKLKGGALMWPVNVDMAKDELYGWLNLEAPTDGSPPPPGYCHFPEYGEDYFKQLTSEQLVSSKTKKGYTRMEWQVIPGRVNHGLDARNYARVAAAMFGMDRFGERDWRRLEESLGVESAPAPKPDATPPASPAPAPLPTAPTAPRRPGWLGPRRNSWLRNR
jgi:phage terminase large subunit GpA-like protein